MDRQRRQAQDLTDSTLPGVLLGDTRQFGQYQASRGSNRFTGFHQGERSEWAHRGSSPEAVTRFVKTPSNDRQYRWTNPKQAPILSRPYLDLGVAWWDYWAS